MTETKYTILDAKMVREASGHTRKMYLARCACGDTRWRYAQHIDKGRSLACRSCANKTHGYSATVEYRCWYHMRDRCLNPANRFYAYYGGRGIRVDPSWDSFEAFLRDMGPCPQGETLERKDNNQGYSKENCVWASRQEQAINRRNTKWITYKGKTQHMAAWSRELGIRQDTLHYRIKKGWSVERAFETRTAHA